MIKALLDDAFCLHLIRRRSAGALAVFADYQPGEVALSALTVATLRARALQSRAPTRNLAALERFLLPLVILEFDAADAQQMERMAAIWRDQPENRDPLPLFLAAQAQRRAAQLITTQPERYLAFPGLRVRAIDGESAASTQSASSSFAARATSGIILAIGSHDLTLDLLGDLLHAAHPQLTMVSAHVGSLEGLLALRRGAAHLAGAHLLDEESGDYNVAYIHRLLTTQGRHVVLVGFVTRVQGLLVAQGNPKGICAIDDLARADVTFVNRQQGAGTRVLLDNALRRSNVNSALIRGYDRQESSHFAVALAIASGAADCGLGIQAAAHIHRLDFVPLFHERYDLVIPVEHYESDLLAPLLALLRRPGDDFLRRVAALGGYTTESMGRVLAEL